MRFSQKEMQSILMRAESIRKAAKPRGLDLLGGIIHFGKKEDPPKRAVRFLLGPSPHDPENIAVSVDISFHPDCEFDPVPLEGLTCRITPLGSIESYLYETHRVEPITIEGES